MLFSITYPLRYFVFLLPILSLVLITACSSQRKATSTTQETAVEQEEYYLSTYPDNPISPLLDDVMKSVKRIITTSFYTHYLFKEDSQITKVDVMQNHFKGQVVESRHSNHSTSGTATVIHNQHERIALISSAHILESPDTLYHHYYTEDQEQTPFLRSVSIRDRKQDLLLSGNTIEHFNILAKDSQKDLVVITVEKMYSQNNDVDFSDSPAMDIQLGRTDQISTATLSYILGYPSGRGMVTRSLVSVPRGDTASNRLWLDALFNPGLSGGLILAFRGEGKSPHWIGMARQTQASNEIYLAPNEDITKSGHYDPNLPYKGETYIKREKRLKYGLAEGISTKAIREFLKNNRIALEENGININRFIERP